MLSAAEGAEPALRPEALEEHWILARLERRPRSWSRRRPSFGFARGGRDALPADLRRLLRLVRRGDQAAALRAATRRRSRPRSPRSSGSLELLHPVMPHVTEEIWSNLPAREGRLIVAPWPEPTGDEATARRRAPARAGRGRRSYRRSGVRVSLSARTSSGSSPPSSGAPRPTGDGDAAAEIARLRKEVARGERMLANDRFVAERAGPTSSRPSARSSSATAGSSMRSSADVAWLESLELFGWRLGLERMQALLERLGDPSGLSRDPRRRDERQDDA